MDKGTLAQDISSYILQKMDIQISIEKIVPKIEREYDVYKISVPTY